MAKLQLSCLKRENRQCTSSRGWVVQQAPQGGESSTSVVRSEPGQERGTWAENPQPHRAHRDQMQGRCSRHTANTQCCPPRLLFLNTGLLFVKAGQGVGRNATQKVKPGKRKTSHQRSEQLSLPNNEEQGSHTSSLLEDWL